MNFQLCLKLGKSERRTRAEHGQSDPVPLEPKMRCPPGENDLDPSDCWDVDFSLEAAEFALAATLVPDREVSCMNNTILGGSRKSTLASPGKSY